ncbi:unnamed protein product [Ostreobium quekettii]|uniref:Uncharacterized protein n=1 Tax=Ostreobium quekettii TaxID=121088 RepID=A0A8S1J0K1_9CHLO|nr:unnamed protein product [Ostreobium quekettii]
MPCTTLCYLHSMCAILCKVTCTSRDNLLNHAHSKGHTKKAKKASVADGATAKQDHTLGGLGTDLGSSSRDVAEQTAASADPCPEKNDRMRKELGSAKEDERSTKSSKKRKALHPADAAYMGQCSADSPAGSKKHKRKRGIVTQVAAESALSLGRETAKDSAGPNKAVDALQEDEGLVGANAVAKKLKKAKKREPGACGGHLKAGLLGNGVVKKKAMKKMARAAACQENGAVLAEDGKEVKKAKKSESKGVVDRENGSMLEDGDAQKEKKKKKSRKRKSKVDVEEQVGGSERIESGKEAKAKQKKKKKERKAADS